MSGSFCELDDLGRCVLMIIGWSPEIMKEKSGCYVIPWGRIGGYNSGLERAVKCVEDGGEGRSEKLWEVCWEICRPYM